MLAKISQDLETQAATAATHHGGSGGKVGAYQAQQRGGTDPMQQIESLISSDLN